MIRTPLPIRPLAMAAVLLALPAAAPATEPVPLRLDMAVEAIGDVVLTADAVPLGHLVAARADDAGELLCIVRLDDALQAQTSALIVQGLTRAADGTLRLPEPAAVLADRMRLPLGTEDG